MASLLQEELQRAPLYSLPFLHESVGASNRQGGDSTDFLTIIAPFLADFSCWLSCWFKNPIGNPFRLFGPSYWMDTLDCTKSYVCPNLTRSQSSFQMCHLAQTHVCPLRAYMYTVAYPVMLSSYPAIPPLHQGPLSPLKGYHDETTESVELMRLEGGRTKVFVPHAVELKLWSNSPTSWYDEEDVTWVR